MFTRPGKYVSRSTKMMDSTGFLLVLFFALQDMKERSGRTGLHIERLNKQETCYTQFVSNVTMINTKQ